MTYHSEDLRWNDPEIEADVAVLWDGDPSPDDQNFYRIGGPNEVRALIGDLCDLLHKMDPQPGDGTSDEKCLLCGKAGYE